jgi:HAD superfamily hydrolase (TIGR01509 family)
MVKLVLFDLDGVLVEAKEIHFNTLNLALAEVSSDYVISRAEHLSIYDGLKTEQKLTMLSAAKGLPVSLHKKIWERKQELTLEQINNFNVDRQLVELFEYLAKAGLKLVCCSNSIRKSVFVMLTKIGIIQYFDLLISNEDVVSSKPHPEMYWKAMAAMKCFPEETLIVEDSPNGLQAAYRTNAEIWRVSGPKELTIENIKSRLTKHKINMNTKWQDEKLNVLIPMAGAGSRFEKAGYTFPKPLIDVNGKPMIQVVVENLNVDAHFIFIVQKSHREKYNLDTLLNVVAPNCDIIEVDGVTEGAACTVLLAKELINNDKPLLMANSDQYVEWNSGEFMYKMHEQDVDGGMLTFESTHPKWSFAKVDQHGYVTEVAEKNPISNIASVGIYYWKHGKDFVTYAEQMIDKNIRVNNEFYVCPVFNEAILGDKKIKTFNVSKMWGIGTPEDLNMFLNRRNDE